MLDFMILGLPRSGTTWAANWLCTETMHCIHDPLFTYGLDELDSIKSSKRLGVSCTGLYWFPDYLRTHSARKVILHRPLTEINASLERIGLPQMNDAAAKMLDAVHGLHIDWAEIRERPELAFEYISGRKWTDADAERHAEVRRMVVETDFSLIEVDCRAIEKLIHGMNVGARSCL